MAQVAYGIDLGTSRTKIAFLEAGRDPKAIEIGGSPLVPSVVWLDDRRGQEPIKVGNAALDSQVLFPSRVVSSVKLHMGKSEAELKASSGLPIEHNGRAYGPVEISAEILKYVVASVRAQGEHAPREVVVTVPAEFDFRQREATVNAVREAGLELKMLLSEPVAALLAESDIDPEGDSKTLVFDLGGGTLDCTIIEVVRGENRVLAKTGELGIAGDKIDQLLFERVAGEFAGQHNVSLDGDEQRVKRARQEILTKCRAAKEKLSEQGIASATVSVSNLQLPTRNVARFETTISREEFEALIQSLVGTYRTHISRALSNASLTADKMDTVLVVGGSGRIPLICRTVEEFFGPAKVRLAEQRDLYVAFGAARAAYALAQGRPVIFDTLTRPLGMQDAGSMRFVPLLPRGTNLAQAEVQQTALWPTGAPSVAINLYEGDEKARSVDDKGPNGPLRSYVGTWEFVPSAPPAPHQPLRFTINCDPQTSLLQVTARLEGKAGGRIEIRRHNRPQLVQGVEAQKQAQLDLMVLLDTTGSLRHSAHWSAVKSDLRTMILRFWDECAGSGAGQVNLRAGLTTFGDLRESALAKGDPLNVFDFTPRQRDFLNYLARLDEFATEGGDDPESCLDALRKAAVSGLRAGDSTLRAFVLITDGSQPAAPVNARPEQIHNELRERDVVVYCISPYSEHYAALVEQTDGHWCEIDDGLLRQHLATVLNDINRRLHDMAA